jgi:hypothetical protein
MKRIILLTVLLLTACLPQVNPPPPQQTEPTAYIDPSYPTMESAPDTTLQVSSGIEVRVNRAWRDGKEVSTEVCFTLLDNSDWSIWNASLQYAGGTVTDFSSTMLSLQDGVNGQNGLRCDTVTFFNIPPDADLSTVVINVDAISATLRPNDLCDIYMPKIQQSFTEQGIGITLSCTDVNGEKSMQIVSKPDTMSQEEAEQFVSSFSEELSTKRGPWAFTFNLGQ